MNPIHVTIQNIAPGDEIPGTDFKVQDHKIAGRSRFLNLTVRDRLTNAFRIQALWDEAREKLYLVGGSSAEPLPSEHIEGIQAVRHTFHTGKISLNISIDLSPLGRRTELKIFKKAKGKACYFGDFGHWRDKQEKLLMVVDTRSKKIIPTYKNKTTRLIQEIPLLKMDQGQVTLPTDVEILSHKIISSKLMLYVAEYSVEDSVSPQIQALWDEPHKRMNLAGCSSDISMGSAPLKRRELWVQIDISSLSLKKDEKFEIFKITNEGEEQIRTCSIPDPMGQSLSFKAIRKSQEPL